MKTLLSLMVSLLALLLSSTPSISAAKKIVFAQAYPPGTPVAEGAILFKNMIESRLKGKIEVDVYPSTQLGNAKQIMDSLQHGAVQIAPIPLYMLSPLTKKFQVFELPFLFEDEGSVTRFQNSSVGESLLDATNNQGYKGLTFWHFGMKQFIANRPLLTPADAKGLKFVVPHMSELTYSKYEAIDAGALSVPYEEEYTALQQGMANGMEGTWQKILHGKFYDVQKYISMTNHAYAGFLLAMNFNFWKSLPPDVKKELGVVIKEVTKEVNKLAVEDSNRAIQMISKSGVVEIKTLTGEERIKWVEQMKPIWKTYEGKIGTEIIQAAMQSGAGGGGDPCPLGTCRCPNRSCKKECCY